jgi:chromosome segregation ATPase
MTPESILVYVQNKALTDAASRQLQAISALKTQIADAGAESKRIDTDIQNITRDEDRNRQNIQSLSGVSGQQQIVQDYARKLADQETQIAKLRARQAELDSRRTSLQSQLNAAIDKLEF